MSDEFEKMKEQRLIARYGLRLLIEKGPISFLEAEEMIENGLLDEPFQECCEALKERGELEHLMMLIWFPFTR